MERKYVEMNRPTCRIFSPIFSPISISDLEFEFYCKCHVQLIDSLVINNEDQDKNLTDKPDYL